MTAIRPLVGEWWRRFQQAARHDLYEDHPEPTQGLRFERQQIGELQLHVFRGARAWGAYEGPDDDLASVHLTYFSRSRRGAWGRYVNFYAAYTRRPYRRQGLALALARHVYRLATEDGYDRLRSLAGSLPGARLHVALGDVFWGLTEKGELVVDSPLRPNSLFEPEMVPQRTRCYGDHLKRMSTDELVAVLKERFGATDDDERAVRARRGDHQ